MDIHVCSEDGKYRYLYSEDRKYRYWLEAKLSEKPGVCLFIMFNPGTGEGKEDRKNHTTRRNCERFTREQGFGTLWTCNLFAFRAGDSKAIRDKSHIGENNDSYILEYAYQADMIVCAWGNNGQYLDRGAEVRCMLVSEGLSDKLRHLGLTKCNQPKHPMILRKKFQPIPFRSQNHDPSRNSQSSRNKPAPSG